MSIKYGKFIPPKIEFKGDITKMKIVTKVKLGFAFASRPLLFKGYLVFHFDKSLAFYNPNTYTLLSKFVFAGEEEDDEIFSFKPIDEDTLLITNYYSARLVRFSEPEPKKLSYEVIQEIKETEYYYLGEKLSNDLILLGGNDKKYSFYKLEHYDSDKRVSKDNLYKKIGEIEDVHNVYSDDTAHIIDLNSGYLFSMMNDDSNIKLIQYEGDFKIITSLDGYQLHDAGLISDKLILLKGLNYPKFYTWLFDLEKLKIVKEWETPNNDGFVQVTSENRFLTGEADSQRFALQEVKEENGEYFLKDVYATDYQGFESFYGNIFLDEKSFMTIAEDKYSVEEDYKSPCYIVVFKCE
jgi:hypothetical protein